MYYILYNAKSAGGTGEKTARKLEEILKGEKLEFKAVNEMDYRSFFTSVDPEAKIVLVGGDGTLNYFVNDVRRLDIKNAVKGNIHNLSLLVSSEQEPTVVVLLDMIRTERPVYFRLIKRMVIHLNCLLADNVVK